MEYFKVYMLIAAFLAVSSRALPMNEADVLADILNSEVDPSDNEIEDALHEIKDTIIVDALLKEESKLSLRKLLEKELSKMMRKGKSAIGNAEREKAHKRAIQSIIDMLNALSVDIPEDIFESNNVVEDNNIDNTVDSEIEPVLEPADQPLPNHIPLFRETFEQDRESLFMPRRKTPNRANFVNPIFENLEPMFDTTTDNTESDSVGSELVPEGLEVQEVEPVQAFGGGDPESFGSMLGEGELSDLGLTRHEEELLSRFVPLV